ncbi:PfkB family carbohydrate kinase [Paenibacillus sp. P25]|nr:PfkB family carbohydrate kinase [Paenibacillus sp. P25]
MFPGGNAVNVAVLCKRYGAEHCSYMGLIGDDRAGSHIIHALRQEGIDISRIRVAAGPSGEARVAMTEDGDRVFVGSNRGGVQDLLTLRLNDEDLAYIRSHDIVHSSVYSHLEHELPKLKDMAVSFDFSTRRDPAYLQLVCPNLTYAFFSGGRPVERRMPGACGSRSGVWGPRHRDYAGAQGPSSQRAEPSTSRASFP